MNRGAPTDRCAQALGGPVGRRTRIGPRSGPGKPGRPGVAGDRLSRPRDRPVNRRQARSPPRPGRGPGPAPDRPPGAAWWHADARAGWPRWPAPADLDQAARRPSAPSGGRRNWPRSRSAGGGPVPMSVSSRPSSRTHLARVTRRTMGSSGLEPGLRRQKERKSWVPSSTSEAASMARRSSGSRTCQTIGSSKGSGAGAFHTR